MDAAQPPACRHPMLELGPELRAGLMAKIRATVAGSCCQRYSGNVRRLTSQRALIALLLVVRLFFGGAVGAMPHTFAELDGGAHTLSAAGFSGGHCPSHDTDSGTHARTPSWDDASHDPVPSGEGDHDCCKSGSCECPCTHFSAHAVILATPLEGFACQLRAVESLIGPPCARPNLLFRPPA
jgi:hypothetical protein